MPELKSVSPILDGLLAGQCFTEHDGVCCYPAIRLETGDKYIIKVVSIPASTVQTEALLLTGAIASHEDAKQYYKTLADEVMAEAQQLNELALLEGFVGCEQVQCEETDDGYEIYLLTPYRESVEIMFKDGSLTHLAAVNLGLDLSAALAACRRAGQMHIDLKPDNVFLAENGSYCIGDIGFIPLRNLKFASLPQKYRSSYTAPEMADCFAQPNDTLDIYALGLIMYQAYNNGQLPFEGNAPTEPLAPPMYADYELSEIIMKACDPDPTQRWQEPAQFGQALTGYMQRNSVNATPIVPPPIPEPVEEPDETEPAIEEFLPEMTESELAEALAAEEAQQDPEQEEIRMIAALAASENPASITEELHQASDEATDEETAQMLAQADELMTLVPPDPVVAPEAIHVPIPTPAEDTVSSEEPDEGSSDDAPTETVAELDVISAPSPRGRKKKKRSYGKFIALLVILVILGGIGFGGYYYYSNYYLQHIDGIQITGTDSVATVKVITDIDESLLVLTCTDSYGNAHIGTLAAGIAVFDNLNPQTHYTISISISGFHELTGQTSGHFTTASRTEIQSFQATVGPEDGSVILSFTTSGPKPSAWTVICTADGQPTLSQSFTGNKVTITGLHVGSQYTFSLVPAEDLFMSGQTQVSFTATNLIFAENPVIDECHDGTVHVTWATPEGETVQYWTVRCYNAAGYDVTVTITSTEYTFENVDHSAATTIEITAAGMIKSVSATVGPNPITVWAVKHKLDDPSCIALSWIFTGHTPEGGWNLTWSIDGVSQQMIACADNSARIPVMVPGSTYEFRITAADGSPIFGGPFTLTLPEAEAFHGYDLTTSDLLAQTLRAPQKESWSWKDVDETCFTGEYQLGETPYLMFSTTLPIVESESSILLSIVTRSEDGQFIHFTSSLHQWNTLWTKGHCFFQLPSPSTAGNYAVSVYLDGMLVCSLALSFS